MDKVKRLRKEVGMSQKEIVNLLGVKQSHYSSLENGVYFPRNRAEIKEEALEILKPLLVKKLLDAQEEVDRLESLIIQYSNK